MAVSLAAVLLPGVSQAQNPIRPERGIYAGASGGVYYESSEGNRGHAPAGAGFIGYRFGSRWAVQFELGRTGTVYCSEQILIPATTGATEGYRHVPVSKNARGPNVFCHSDGIVNLDVVRRFPLGRLRPYVMLGLSAGVHLGFGIEIPLGRTLALAPGVDVNAGPEYGGMRPRVALLARF